MIDVIGLLVVTVGGWDEACQDTCQHAHLVITSRWSEKGIIRCVPSVDAGK